MRDPWIRRASALLTGGLIGAYIPSQGCFWMLGLLGLLGLRLLLWRPRDFFGKLFRPEIPILAFSLVMGFIYGALAEGALPEPLILDRTEVVGCLQDWNIYEDKAVGIIRIEEGELKGQFYRLSVYPDQRGEISSEWKRVQPGDQLSFQAHLERPKILGTPGGFDQRLYYGVRGLRGTMYAQGDVQLLSAGEPRLSWKIRQSVRNCLLIWDSEETGVLEGILFGDSTQIPDTIQETYKITGVLHVFAASGSNVAFVLGLSWLLLSFLPEKVRTVVTISALILYADLCGGNSPIVRATILGIALLLGRLGRGKTATLRWLFLAALGLFIYNPLVIQDLGFQLSFAAAWGILVLSPITVRMKIISCLPSLIRVPAAATLAAQWATLPILVASFHRLSFIGMIANIFVLFILGSVLEVGLVGVVLSFSAVFSTPLFQVSLWLLQGTNAILKMLAELPYADVWVLNPGPLFWLIWYGGIGIILWGKERALFTLKVKWICYRRNLSVLASKLDEYCPGEYCKVLRRWLVNLSFKPIGKEWDLASWAGILLMLLLLWSPWNGRNYLEVVMIDVGQGDAILILTPKKHAVLIDAGPRSETFDAGERIVLPYLLNRGTRHLEAMLITHEDADHIGGVRAVLKTIPTDRIGVPDVGERLENDEWLQGLPQGLPRQSEILWMLKAGDRVELESEVWLDVLGPSRALEGTRSDPNNNSLVLKVNYLGQSVTLTGDMEQEEMEEIFEAGVNIDTDIFKVPHHGSRFSMYTPWLDGMEPQAVMISVGKNSFGHPSNDVLDYWEERHVPILRTDNQGTIRFLLDSHGIEMITGR
ncbi:DNA internalization-related competence protein ComEC/Rec2 [Desulfosporosinus orientis]|nr:DNA internalization-related competence protein ComEC/Rec2 [Desulfosporosinus orientis]